ncbi:MAG: hypothetical protein HY578_08475 [Nitrospinae bacterium]|nr:hypothetical protein [Nitrospinota bacterium]
MSKFYIDFELTGHIAVDAETGEDAKEIIAEKISLEELLENIQKFNVGKYYVERVLNTKEEDAYIQSL